MWRDLLRYAEVTSTNDLARDHARRGVAEGTVVVTGYQTAGRGRQGREWLAPPGTSLLMSIILRPNPALARSAWLTLIGGVGVAEVIGEVCDLPARVKWPNDVRIDGRKVAGVLAEGSRIEGAPVVVLGIGLNVAQTADQFPPELAETATSLRLAGEREWTPRELLQPVWQRLRELYEELQRDAVATVRRRWESVDETVGRLVTVEVGETLWRGRATRIDDHGSLWIEDEAGELREVTAGEVTLRFEA